MSKVKVQYVEWPLSQTSPTAHNAFSDAIVMGSSLRLYYGGPPTRRRDLQVLWGEDKLEHLRSWGVKGTSAYSIWHDSREFEQFKKTAQYFRKITVVNYSDVTPNDDEYEPRDAITDTLESMINFMVIVRYGSPHEYSGFARGRLLRMPNGLFGIVAEQNAGMIVFDQTCVKAITSEEGVGTVIILNGFRASRPLLKGLKQ